MSQADMTSPAGPSDKSNNIEIISPITGEVLGSVPTCSADEVDAAVARARAASEEWSALSFSGRAEQLARWRRALAERAEELADLIHRENGKPKLDAIVEVALALSHLAYAASHAEKALARRRVNSGLLANYRATISYHPLGVIGAIGPWNYPIFTPMGSIGYALAAGNTVVFKPSELTPLIGRKLVEIASSAIEVPHVVQLVTGGGETGAALARARVDKIAFTGSAATGRKVMAAAAENLTPVLMELGGKDPLVVAEDADVDRAAQAAVFGALHNAGQTCVSIERAYVASAIYDRFLDRVVSETGRVTVGGGDADYGAMTSAAQVDIIRDQLRDAIAKGARALVGGPDAIDGRLVSPTVLVDVTDDMRIMQEETFGPVLPIIKVQDADEGIRRANQSRFGLGSAIFGQQRVRELGDRIRAGMTSINSVLSYTAIPTLPFGGVGESGFGRIHGVEGLREFTRIKATAEERFALPINLLSFNLPSNTYERVNALIQRLHGGGVIDRAAAALGKWF